MSPRPAAPRPRIPRAEFRPPPAPRDHALTPPARLYPSPFTPLVSSLPSPLFPARHCSSLRLASSPARRLFAPTGSPDPRATLGARYPRPPRRLRYPRSPRPLAPPRSAPARAAFREKLKDNDGLQYRRRDVLAFLRRALLRQSSTVHGVPLDTSPPARLCMHAARSRASLLLPSYLPAPFPLRRPSFVPHAPTLSSPPLLQGESRTNPRMYVAPTQPRIEGEASRVMAGAGFEVTKRETITVLTSRCKSADCEDRRHRCAVNMRDAAMNQRALTPSSSCQRREITRNSRVSPPKAFLQAPWSVAPPIAVRVGRRVRGSWPISSAQMPLPVARTSLARRGMQELVVAGCMDGVAVVDAGVGPRGRREFTNIPPRPPSTSGV
ncbi:hypothetical protein B0H16DRAFT_1718469 [Mycena metata]|uniref:Uncharacterized protein n=1 Tax=Mycena metata TaxID=1033252 RepID=A0AAD7JGB9_9AGAR|nr:hypothetical protein B0H16DRAFT_1718469 [Mycena metata]